MEADNAADASADPDPIVASYKVYANPALATARKLLIMQHPNQQGPLNYPHAQVSGVRIKNRSGMVEVDVPVSHAHADYDRDKGQRWGGALAKSLAAKNGGTHGLAGGFGVGVSTMRPNKRRDDFERDIDTMDWSEAVRQDKVLRTKTLGGQIPAESETEPQWMVGVFKGDHLYLTPASALIQLRPQLHHIDAMTEQERARRREGAGAGAGAVGGKDGVPAAASAAGARAIHMSIKSADSGGGGLTTETMADRLRTVQTEAWSRLQYEDDESAKSWNVFNNNLVYRGAKKAAANQGQDEDKGKGKGKATDAIQIDSSSSSDSEQLCTQWVADEYLKAISAMKNGPEGSQKQEDAFEIKKEGGVGNTATGASAKDKGTATASPTSAGRKSSTNAKGKSVAFKGTDMETD
ncbi:Sin-like protein conserved region-domain-containing protein [Xylaria acuta]|nr:Sin-like protein conserved region-domain-containing protein [Xylaria acuta]